MTTIRHRIATRLSAQLQVYIVGANDSVERTTVNVNPLSVFYSDARQLQVRVLRLEQQIAGLVVIMHLLIVVAD